jgi:LacI family transcriptional regulator
LAVRYLAERGHRHIGFIQMAFAMPLVFHRHRGYLQGMADAGLDSSDRLVLWIERGDEQQQTRKIQRYLDHCAPTAVVLGTCWPLTYMAPLIRAGKLRIPQDLSVVNFDQHGACAEWLGGIAPTVVELPMRQMGHRLAEMARQIVDGRQFPQTTWLPCTLREGAAVASLQETN